jgi:tetratricopeptide (TPR) repeat protein
MSADPRLVELVLRWEEQRDQGQEATPEELCRHCPELLEDFRRAIAGLRALGPLLSTVGDPAPIPPAPPPDNGTTAETAWAVPGSRYQPRGFHTKGGLGEIHRGEDIELHRPVALKRIQGQRDSADNRRRFLREAEITARLQHPGIVPVYGLVQDDEGRPCYAMRFIEGESLRDAIPRFHDADRPGRDAGERNLALRRLLTRFVAACRTVAYAHSRGIMHLDLKPGNLMLGDYDETLVVDWGLARSFAQRGPERSGDEPALLPVVGEDEASREMGQAPGTPAYMSPEQAAGRWDVIGPTSDVYSLGATLYHLLTGRAPFTGSSPAEVLQGVKRGDLAPPRQVKPAVPRPLEAVCRKALAPRPEDRYGTAVELAAEVERWLADEPVRAYPEPLRVRARRWARRHRPLVAGTLALVMATLLLGGSGLGWFLRQQSAIAQEVEADLREAESLLARGTSPDALLQRAEGRLTRIGPARLRERIDRLRKQIAFAEELDEARLQAATWAGTDFDRPGADRAYTAAFARHGLDLAALPPEEVARGIRDLALRPRVAVALDNWADVKDHLPGGDGEPLRGIARLVDDDPWRQQLRDPAVRQDAAALQALAQAKDALDQPPVNLALLELALRKQNRWAAAERFLRQALERHADDFWLNYDLAGLLSQDKPGGLPEAIGYYRAALACRPGTVAIYNDLGADLARLGNLAEAVEACRQAIARKPDFAVAYTNLGDALREQGKLAEAVEAHCQAIAYEPGYAEAYNNLGLALRQQRKLAEAVDAYCKALARNPDLGQAYQNLGLALADQGKLAEAEQACRQAVARMPDLAEARYSLGIVLADQGKLAEAADAYRQAIARKPDLVGAHYNLGLALGEEGRLAEAADAYRQAIARWPDFAEAHCNLGNTLLEQGQFADALASLKRGHELGSRRPDWQYPSAEWVRRAERLVQLDSKLPKVLSGEAQPADAAERVELARLCQEQFKQLYAAATRFYTDAFTADPHLADSRRAQHRYNAACAAALAGRGRGKDAARFDDQDRARVRHLALDWLRAELGAWQKLRQKDPEKAGAVVRQTLQHWQDDADLAGVRGEDLVKLPAAERQEWQKLWADVAALLGEVRRPVKPVAGP